jgi:hypothetical protein
MAMGPRQTGGQNNRRGNRYEDFFATYKLLESIPGHIDRNENIRLKEQVGTPIDDLFVETANVDYYHQLKSGLQTTWGQKGGKLEQEFRAQHAECKTKNKKYKLVLVVRDEARRKLLAENIPKGLKSVTKVFVFPPLARPSELVRQRRLLRRILSDISASTIYSESEHQIIVNGVYAAWIDHEPDMDGFCCLRRLMTTIRQSYERCRIHAEWTHRPNTWPAAEAILNQIPGFSWTVERGYFE